MENKELRNMQIKKVNSRKKFEIKILEKDGLENRELENV